MANAAFRIRRANGQEGPWQPVGVRRFAGDAGNAGSVSPRLRFMYCSVYPLHTFFLPAIENITRITRITRKMLCRSMCLAGVMLRHQPDERPSG